jgi:hypothetical protein
LKAVTGADRVAATLDKYTALLMEGTSQQQRMQPNARQLQLEC